MHLRSKQSFHSIRLNASCFSKPRGFITASFLFATLQQWNSTDPRHHNLTVRAVPTFFFFFFLLRSDRWSHSVLWMCGCVAQTIPLPPRCFCGPCVASPLFPCCTRLRCTSTVSSLSVRSRPVCCAFRCTSERGGDPLLWLNLGCLQGGVLAGQAKHVAILTSVTVVYLCCLSLSASGIRNRGIECKRSPCTIFMYVF